MKQWKNGLQLIRKTKFKNKHIDICVCLFVRLLINLTMMWLYTFGVGIIQ